MFNMNFTEDTKDYFKVNVLSPANYALKKFSFKPASQVNTIQRLKWLLCVRHGWTCRMNWAEYLQLCIAYHRILQLPRAGQQIVDADRPVGKTTASQ